jgi:SAM-dependent methyltransferase
MTIYNDAFFSGLKDGSARSAAVIVPLVLQHFPARSVVDVGCGIGTWLAEFARRGVVEYLGADGDYVPRDRLMIPVSNFHACDLATFSAPTRRFDLACSLEVAEHLPPDRASHFVAALTELAPAVLFSAAIPGQRGIGHVNEQWPSYWAALFEARGYAGIDCVRPDVFGDQRVEPWYRQNTIVFCERTKIPEGLTAMKSPYDYDRVDPAMWGYRCEDAKPRETRLRRLLRSLAE